MRWPRVTMKTYRFGVVVLALALLGAGGFERPHYFVLDLRGDGLALGGVNRSTGTRWTLPQTHDAFLAVDATGLHAMGIDVFRDGARLEGIALLSSALRIVVDGQRHEGDRISPLLAALDCNRDGRLDNRDAAWSGLRIFVDTDADGRIGLSELRSAAEASIASIAVKTATEARSDVAEERQELRR